MKTSRQRVLEYIQGQRTVTAGELSTVLHMTPANARHHLGILAEQGLVEVIGERISGRGRPSLVYSISRQSQGDNLAGLAHALLTGLLSLRDPEEQTPLLANLASRLGGDAMQIFSSRSLTLRLSRAVQRLNEMAYQARWEAHSSGPRLLLNHCPYTAILNDHPELCHVDALLMQELLGAKVEQQVKLKPDTRGARYCMFQVKGKLASEPASITELRGD